VREPRRTCGECLEEVDPADPNVVLAVDPVPREVTGFSAMGVREYERLQPVCFHRDHVWRGWKAMPPPDTWDD
jgi:hypothetical protein